METKNYKALVAEEKNGTYIQSVKTLKSSDLPDHDVLIRVHYSSLNYKDALSASGNKGVTKSYPFTPGIDASGIVEKSRDPRFKEGDKVLVTSYDLGMNTPGGFGQYISVPGDWIIPLPDSLSLKESMLIGTSGLTAAIGIDHIISRQIELDSGLVIVTGATGAVGSFAVSLLSHLNYKVIAATGKVDQTAFLKTLGAQEVIHRDEISEVSNNPLLKGRWIAGIDTVGGSMLDAILRQTEHNGVIACCGNILGHELNTSIYPFILRGVTLAGIDSGIALMDDRLKIWRKLASEWKLDQLNKLARTVDLDALPDEISKMLEGKQTGKVVVSLLD